MRCFRIIIAFIIAAACVAPGVRSKPQKKILCRFAGKEYSPGDVWYPHHERYCIRCSCLTTGKLNCTSQECPSDCATGVKVTEHPCCRTCWSSSGSSSGSVSSDVGAHGRVPLDSGSLVDGAGGMGGVSLGGATLPSAGHSSAGDEEEEEEEEEEMLVTENPEFVSCLHQGKIYRDGEAFTANVTGLPISAVDQCMQCVCQSGMVLCQMKSCSSVKCGSGMSSLPASDTCCQRCSAWRGGSRMKVDDEDDVHLFPVLPGDHKDSRDASLTSEGGSSGGFIGGLGSLPESSVTFRDVSAVDSVDRGRGVKKQAADDCISGGRFYMHGSKWHPIIGPFGIMECVVCTCMEGEIDCNRLKCPPKKDMPCPKPAKVEGHCCPICTSSSSSEGSKMCVSGKQDVTAFRSHGFGLNSTELFQFGFVKQRRSMDPQIDHHEWTLKAGEILQFTTRYISMEDFADLRNRQTFVLLGATNEKNVEKFTRREKKLEKRCASRCGARILGLERSLRIHRLTSRKQCLAHERTVST